MAVDWAFRCLNTDGKMCMNCLMAMKQGRIPGPVWIGNGLYRVHISIFYDSTGIRPGLIDVVYRGFHMNKEILRVHGVVF